MPIKKKTMVARKRCYADGGQALLEETKRRIARREAGIPEDYPTYSEAVKDRIKELGARAKEAVTPNIAKTIAERTRRIDTAADEAGGYKRGGQVKSKARGDGCVQRGKTKGRQV